MIDITRSPDGWTNIYMPFTDLNDYQLRALRAAWEDYETLHSPPHVPRRFPPDMGDRTGISLTLPTAEEHLALNIIQRVKDAPDPHKQEKSKQ